jgi:peptidoglycan biosynthesis protein MviN/MurJ (putative lipid II flippase)
VLTLSELALGVVLMFVLAPHFGLNGLALASLIANLVLGMGFQIPITVRAVGTRLTTFLGTTFGRLAMAVIPAVAAALALRSTVEEGGWAMLIGATLAVAAVYGVSLLVVGTRRDERALYLSLLKR